MVRKPFLDLYWRLRWVLWDAEDAVFVRAVARRMHRTRTLYVHPHGEARAAVAITRDIDRLPEDDWDHCHVEGKMSARSRGTKAGS